MEHAIDPRAHFLFCLFNAMNGRLTLQYCCTAAVAPNKIVHAVLVYTEALPRQDGTNKAPRLNSLPDIVNHTTALQTAASGPVSTAL